jgi:AcrR family transcriptional regulator
MVSVSDRQPPAISGSADRYHHGDLRNALVQAATELAREGGPAAVVLREAARRAGVSAAAAYHHFAGREELAQAVKQRSLDLLTERMRAAGADAATPALDRLRALGLAYLGFAASEPGLFRLTFGPHGNWPSAGPPDSDHASTDPFRLLAQALDELVAAGAVPADRRPGLEYVAWAAVHGTAVLCLDGPLAAAGQAERELLAARALDTIIRGL